jgi:hypothetical protein
MESLSIHNENIKLADLHFWPHMFPDRNLDTSQLGNVNYCNLSKLYSKLQLYRYIYLKLYGIDTMIT